MKRPIPPNSSLAWSPGVQSSQAKLVTTLVIVLRQILLVLGLTLWLGSQAWADPLTITTNNSSEVHTKAEDETVYTLRSATTPYVHELEAGQRIDVLVRSRKNYFQDWVGEVQGLSAPAEVFVEQDTQNSWPRILPVVAACLVLLSLGFATWRRRIQSTVSQVEADIRRSRHRAQIAKSLTSIPKRLGEYQILEQAGAGSYATVYKAVDPKGRVFALKVPREDTERDQREWSILQKLDSPHIVKTYGRVDEPTSGSPPFLVLELLEGETLSKRISRQRPSAEEAHLWVGQLLEGLISSHSQGVIHRDIKPDNLILEQDGNDTRLVITDFGVARDHTLSRLTKTGQGLGSAAYAPPEQIRGQALDERADLYAVGVVAFELLTGELPWTFQSSQDLFGAKEKGMTSQAKLLGSQMLPNGVELLTDLLQPDKNLRPDNAKTTQERWNEIWKSSIS